jgi:hypothetical protein
MTACNFGWRGTADGVIHCCELPPNHNEMKQHGPEHRCFCGAGSNEKVPGDILNAATWRRQR